MKKMAEYVEREAIMKFPIRKYHCEQAEGVNTRSKSLFDAYKIWCKSNGYFACSAKRFNADLEARPEWHGGKYDDVPNKLPLYQRKGRSKPNFAFLHKSAWKDIPQLAWHGQPTTDAELRAMTPPGFAWAFYEANKEEDG